MSIERFIDQRGLARAGNSSHYRANTERHFDINLLEVVTGRTFDVEPVFSRFYTFGNRNATGP